MTPTTFELFTLVNDVIMEHGVQLRDKEVLQLLAKRQPQLDWAQGTLALKYYWAAKSVAYRYSRRSLKNDRKQRKA